MAFDATASLASPRCGLWLAFVVVIGIVGMVDGDGLWMNFYEDTCPHVEDIVKTVVWKRVAANPELPAKLLRLHFHDCIVRGCDGSVLLNSTANNEAEKDALVNLSLSGYDVIDEVKEVLEQACPGTVSCADILALAARDSTSFQFQKPLWEVPTGRRDGTISNKTEAFHTIPEHTADFAYQKLRFEERGLTVRDLVVLTGSHTLGVGHCNLFGVRLYNFTGKGDMDPSLDPTYAEFLKTKCKTYTEFTAVPMNPRSSTTFDTAYYTLLKEHKAMFTSDMALLSDMESSEIVDEMLTSGKFIAEFGESMKRLGAVGVLTGDSGEIRKICSAVNA